MRSAYATREVILSGAIALAADFATQRRDRRMAERRGYQRDFGFTGRGQPKTIWRAVHAIRMHAARVHRAGDTMVGTNRPSARSGCSPEPAWARPTTLKQAASSAATSVLNGQTSSTIFCPSPCVTTGAMPASRTVSSARRLDALTQPRTDQTQIARPEATPQHFVQLHVA